MSGRKGLALTRDLKNVGSPLETNVRKLLRVPVKTGQNKCSTRSALLWVVNRWYPVGGFVVELAEDFIRQLEPLDFASLKLDRLVRRKKFPIAKVS